MGFQHGAGFRICGAVVRKFVNGKHNFASLTLDVVGAPRSKKIDLRAFDEDIVHQIGQLGAGQTIEVTGSVDVETIKAKDRKEVLVDGYSKWVSVLTARSIKVEGSSVQPRNEPKREAGAEPPAPSAPAGGGWNDEDDIDDDRIF